ncbi:MAG: chemotaxis protein CheW [Vicinamibacterales bacterium]|nr:chemotaxis protein CheW [Vicinamibacterales bacterium]
MTEREELLNEFLIESYENLDRLDQDLVALEQDPQNRERLGSVFRTIHTIKGTCGFLAFSRLEAVAHVGENLLSRLRDLDLLLTADITTGLLAMVDAIRQMLASIESTGQEGDADHTELIAALTRLNQAGKIQAQSPVATVVAPAAEVAASVPAPAQVMAPVVAEPTGASAAAQAPATDDDRRPAVSDSSLRVDVTLLDKLMNLVGELVLARNQILQFTTAHADSSLVGASGRLNLVTSELQEGVMKTRMQPIGNIWSKFPRIVRDLATTCAKEVRLEMEGRETDLDKTIIEAIKDPLTHIVRNSVDHGIESPAERRAKGKNPEGRILLRAFHEGGQINIEISDDGAGISPAKVRAKALEKTLVTVEQAAAMSDHEVMRLIFAPGFSTAEKVTNVSGRGVGMDVVKTNIEKIGGQVDIQSKIGEGTTLKIKIPLTLAIIPALMVAAGGDRYAIPQVSLLELVRLEGEQARQGVERIQQALFYRLRGNLLPLVYLNRELAVELVREEDAINIVVLKADDRQFGLIVEEINDTEEIVVKPLGTQLKGTTVFAGATIMGDGKVALILDVLGIAQRANVVSELRDRARTPASARPKAEAAGDQRTLLLFRVGESDRMAVPLGQVARLEEFPQSSIERSGENDVVQYRDEILPLISLSAFFGHPGEAASDPRQVIVFAENGRSVGIVVGQILDIVTEHVALQHRSTRTGVLGSAVIQHRVTDLLDAHAIMRAVDPTFLVADAA